MKKIFISFLLLIHIIGQAQISQKINLSDTAFTNQIYDIDSIWFNTFSNQMKVIIPGQECSTSYNLGDIANVTFTGSPNPAISHTCGAANVHKDGLSYGSMTDQQGNVYKTIVIGGKEWMAENLRTSIYRTGDSIPKVMDVQFWQGLTSGAWVHYDNNAAYDCPFGKLYNWYAVTDSRNICPAGWHVPSDAEWTTLEDSLGGRQVAGTKMKSLPIRYWQCPNEFSTNSSGFSGLPGGGRIIFGGFYQYGFKGWWWTSSQLDQNLGFNRTLDYNTNSVFKNEMGSDKKHGFNVRCIKD
jgi:uncharacterized protein (TIGR02145 family)